jgi:hypothetical protein
VVGVKSPTNLLAAFSAVNGHTAYMDSIFEIPNERMS